MAKIPYNFGGLLSEHSSYQASQIVILPVAFDKTSSWQRGSRKGPRAMIRASRFMELFDIETGTEVFKKGIFTAKRIRAAGSQSLYRKVEQQVSKYLSDDKFVVTLGGEHSVSLGAITAAQKRFADLTVLHLDAHADLRDDYEGDKLNHACVMARVKEKVAKIVSVGIRSMDISEKEQDKKVTGFTMEKINLESNWIAQVNNQISSPVYVTVDLDVFDPGIMPATGTPEPGGLSWYQVLTLLREVAKTKTVAGFDIVELRPEKNKAPDFLAAKLLYKFLSYIYYYQV